MIIRPINISKGCLGKKKEKEKKLEVYFDS